jgi:predicted alpha/beta superfamily hydrolase
MKHLLIALLLLSAYGVHGQPATAPVAPFVLGDIRTIKSAALGEERTLNIYLPQGYNPQDTVRYPVIYLLDGSADEDFVHIAGLMQFCNFPWVNIWPRSIIVGIANVDRRRDFTFPTTIEKDKKDYPTTGGSAKFIAFLGRELQPFIDAHYRTGPSKALIGQSLGGLLATEVLFTQPGLFDTYIIVSPSLWWDKESLLSRKAAVLQPGYKRPVSVYIGVGKEGEVMEGDARRLADMLKAGTDKRLKVRFEYFGQEDHASILHQAVYNAFKALRPVQPAK